MSQKTLDCAVLISPQSKQNKNQIISHLSLLLCAVTFALLLFTWGLVLEVKGVWVDFCFLRLKEIA